MSALCEILSEALKRDASDVHLLTNKAPAFRVNGAIEASARPPLTEQQLTAALDELLDPQQRAVWLTDKRLCFSWYRPELGYFRISIYSHLGRMEASIRVGRTQVPSLAELGLPERLMDFVRAPTGLILVTGPTGVGKTTTLNALLGRINAEDRRKIITIEDPIEFLMPKGRALVVQQELGLDTNSFHEALIHALRQDPDLICVGEMRELDTIATALTAAETGHLVLATLHTSGAASTISRIIDAFPANQQANVRVQLSSVLRATLSQRLLPRADGQGRTLVYELMVANEAVRTIIRDARTHQLDNVLQTSARQGMVRMDQMVRDAWLAGEITYDVALGAVRDARILG